MLGHTENNTWEMIVRPLLQTLNYWKLCCIQRVYQHRANITQDKRVDRGLYSPTDTNKIWLVDMFASGLNFVLYKYLIFQTYIVHVNDLEGKKIYTLI